MKCLPAVMRRVDFASENESIMIWRFWAWVMVIYIAVGGAVVAVLIGTIGFMQPGSRIDWSVVPPNAIIPVWFTESLAGYAAFVIAAIPAPIGFFRRAGGLAAR